MRTQQFRDGLAAGQGSLSAFGLMTSENEQDEGALTLRQQFAPYQDWDAIEQGDMHYLTAFISSNLNFVAIEPMQLTAARTEYENVLDHNPAGWWFTGEPIRRIRKAAKAGINRVRRAQQNNLYDTDWILPPSLQKAKNDA